MNTKTIDTTVPVIGDDGEAMVHPAPEGVTPKDVTACDVIREALRTPVPEMPWEPETMMRAVELSRAASRGTIELTTEDDKDGPSDRKFILDRAFKVYKDRLNGSMVYIFLTELFADTPALAAVEPEAVSG